jgi:hypothetical protein
VCGRSCRQIRITSPLYNRVHWRRVSDEFIVPDLPVYHREPVGLSFDAP